MIAARTGTRVRTHDFLLKGLIFCHECGYPLGVIQRPLAHDKLALYFVCRTYQRFTTEHKCTCHCVRVETVTAAVLEKVRAICEEYLDRDRCVVQVEAAASRRPAKTDPEEEIRRIESQIANLTAHLDSTYDDKLSGALADVDFQRIYDKIKRERLGLQERLKALKNQPESLPVPQVDPKPLIMQFLYSVDTNKALLINLIERIELTEEKEIIIKFRFDELQNRRL